MTSSRFFRQCVSALALSFASAHAFASCPAPTDQAGQIAEASALSVQTYNRESLDCAARLAIAAANAAPDDLQAQGMALGFTAAALDLLGSLKREDLTGTETHLLERIEELSKQALAIGSRSLKRAPDNADIKTLYGVVLVLSGQWVEVERGIAQTRTAMGLFEDVIRSSPATLGGTAQLVLGRIYFELPPLLGGNLERSITLLVDATKRDPTNPQALRYLAEAYDQEMEEEKAKVALTAMLALGSEPGKHQLLADELRMGAGLAQRLGAVDLRTRLLEKRAEHLEQHPELLTRESTAVNGHGGDNPLTDK